MSCSSSTAEAAVPARFPVVFFDLDGTLLRGISTALLADWVGKHGALDELERDYRDGLISNAVVAETSAPWFEGLSLEDVARVLDGAAWIDGIADVVAELRSGGVYVAVATVSWSFSAEIVARRYGFDAWCGTEMAVVGGRAAGTVTRHCDADEKAAFAAKLCADRGVALSAAAAVGDSRSDLPMFAQLGYSIALNADDAARAAATTAIDTDDLRDLLPLLLDTRAN